MEQGKEEKGVTGCKTSDEKNVTEKCENTKK